MAYQRTIEVGIVSAKEICFQILASDMGPCKVEYRDHRIVYKGEQYSELVFNAPDSDSSFAPPAFKLFGVTIGIGFHWERKQDQVFAGTLKFIVDGDAVTAVNVIGIEDYLVSVISSEMKASASLELLKAHSVISRSWVVSQIERRQKGEANPGQAPACREDGSLVKWWDHDDHNSYDVCADDHCQRYQGLTDALGENVRKAVLETWGQVLKFNGELCDARFSKCCGGVTERFSTCWEDRDFPYLKSLKDEPEGGGKCFCDTEDEGILSQILNDYDLETKDFFRWETVYSRAELSELVNRRSGMDFGTITGMDPVSRGGSGRISLLRITGTRGSAVIGKELMIRKVLSESHLKSSAFDMEWQGDKLILRGRGWGHGVGLCQIGAAVMAHRGYGYKQILSHYYPGTVLE